MRLSARHPKNHADPERTNTDGPPMGAPCRGAACSAGKTDERNGFKPHPAPRQRKKMILRPDAYLEAKPFIVKKLKEQGAEISQPSAKGEQHT
jgi:hypothetical protein